MRPPISLGGGLRGICDPVQNGWKPDLDENTLKNGQIGCLRASREGAKPPASNTHKLLLAFDAFAFAQVAEITPHFGELIAGEQLRRMRVALTPLYLRVRSILETATELFVVPGASPTPVEDEINESGRSQKTSCVKFPRLTRLSKT